MQFICHDNPKKPQIASIDWQKVIEDDDCQDRPDERDDGFWPSNDPNAAGYVKPEDYDKQLASATERYNAWKRGDWNFIGVRARAVITLPIGGTSFVTYELVSPGLWGIESDAGDYLDEIFKEEKATLLDHLRAIGAAANAT
jgi:hypothetical protein